MKIEDLPLPDIIKEKLITEGISSLYPPQEEAIKKGLFDGTNLVVAIPTASGKTLLALFASIKKLTETGLKTLYLSPLRALAFEKYMEFKSFLDLLNKKIILLTGDYDEEDTRAQYADVIIATNEKIDSAIRHQARWINKIGLIVSDEVHLINDSSRGPTLEVVIAQLRQVCDAQILALSATIRNADQIARWLEAELVSSNWRPVKLKEGVLFDKTIVYGDGTEVTIPSKLKDSFNNLTDYILSKKNQALVFATTRNMAESTAKNLASRTNKTLSKEEKEKLNATSSEILNTGEQTKQS
ncbi:MAG: DEAD/DEAH box helicase, partial [Candidatus Heimdallarchaeota archaeon]|nr:DEAD/DEAH box helicase [Candidatus Heimdallarchaeota archaeon]